MIAPDACYYTSEDVEALLALVVFQRRVLLWPFALSVIALRQGRTPHAGMIAAEASLSVAVLPLGVYAGASVAKRFQVGVTLLRGDAPIRCVCVALGWVTLCLGRWTGAAPAFAT